MTNVSDLFPKRKRVVGYNDYHGKRSAYSLRQDQAWHDKHGLKKVAGWDDMLGDIWACETQFQLQKCRFFWAAKAIEYEWPPEWIPAASEEFDKAVEALAAQQAE